MSTSAKPSVTRVAAVTRRTSFISVAVQSRSSVNVTCRGSGPSAALLVGMGGSIEAALVLREAWDVVSVLEVVVCVVASRHFGKRLR